MEEKKEPRFWKGDAVAGFVYGMFGGLLVGILNIAFLHIWHIGIIAWIVIWLVVGTQPRFKDKRTPDQVKKDNAKFMSHVQEKNEKKSLEKVNPVQQVVIQKN